MNISSIEKLKIDFDNIISKYNFNQGSKTQELVDYIISKQTHDSRDLAKHFNIEIEEAQILLEFFKKGVEFKNSTKPQ